MIKRLTVVFLFSIFLSGCALFSNGEPLEVIDIHILPIEIPENVRIEGRDVSGCSIEERMTYAMLENDHEFGLNVVSEVETESRIPYSAIVKIKSIDANIYIPMPEPLGFNKPASMVFSVEVQENGKKIRKISKRINTKLLFGSCDRIERIANAAGVYVVNWSSKVIRSTRNQ